MTVRIDEPLVLTSTLTCGETSLSRQTRDSILKQDDNKRFPIALTDFRVHDAMQTNLPGTAASDDLALIGGTFGTSPSMIQAGDLKAAGATTRYARVEAPLPECYVAGQTVLLSIFAGMITTEADNSCTVDVECYQRAKDGTLSGSPTDLCATAAQSINNTVFAEKQFTITSTGLAPGDVLEIRIAIACNDAGTGTEVLPAIAAVDLMCDIRG